MSDYPLSLTGAEIDSALGRVHNAETFPVEGNNMITSGGVLTAINNLDLTNIAGSALVEENEGIEQNDNDTTIPTSAAVKDYVDTNVPTIQSGVTDIPLTSSGVSLTASGTATAAGFFLVGTKIRQLISDYVGGIEIIVGGLTYENKQLNIQGSAVGSDLYMCVPVAKGEAWTITVEGGDRYARFKELS